MHVLFETKRVLFQAKSCSSSPKLKQHKIAKKLSADALLNNAHSNSESFTCVQKSADWSNFLPLPQGGPFLDSWAQSWTSVSCTVPYRCKLQLQESCLTRHKTGLRESRQALPNFLQILNASCYRVFGQVYHAAHPHTCMGNCNQLSSTSSGTTSAVSGYIESFQLTHSYFYR